ncbi:MAG: TonB family protein, partial [Desulfuromonadaceae bacterium]
AACLVISLALHLAAVIAVLLASTQRSYGPVVTYIDINSSAESVSRAAPVIHSPSPHSEIIKDEQPAIVPENSSDSPKTEAPPETVQPPVPGILATSLGRGMASGYFSSLGEGKNLRDDIREYYFLVLEKVNSRWWLKAETLKEAALHDGMVEFLVGRDGTLIDSRLLKSTGSREVDRAIIEVLKEAAPFPPLPASYDPDLFRAPLKIAAPLHLFSVRSQR